MPSDYIFCITCKQYCSFTDFATCRLGAPYNTYKFYKVNSFFTLLIHRIFNFIYRIEKKPVLIAFSGLSAAYKPNYTRHYFRRCFRRYFCYYFRRYFYYYFFLYFPSLYTARINLAATYDN